MVPLDRLKKLKIFKEALPASLERLSKDMVEKTYASGDIVLKEGEASGALYLILSGSVAVQKKVEGDQSKVVARLEAEEFFGEMSFLENQPHSATIVAQEETTIFLLPRTALNELIQKDATVALDQVLTLLSGVSARLRRTTRELVGVFETARYVGQSLSVEDLMEKIIGRLRSDLGEAVSGAFYRWNLYNDEYALIRSQGPAGTSFVPEIESRSALLAKLPESELMVVPDLAKHPQPVSPFSFSKGVLVASRIDMRGRRQGLLIFYSEEPRVFDSGEKQMIETISAVLAPALETACAREEEAARVKLEQNKQRYSI
jgi:CRP-like cAMP-binding protein